MYLFLFKILPVSGTTTKTRNTHDAGTTFGLILACDQKFCLDLLILFVPDGNPSFATYLSVFSFSSVGQPI